MSIAIGERRFTSEVSVAIRAQSPLFSSIHEAFTCQGSPSIMHKQAIKRAYRNGICIRRSIRYVLFFVLFVPICCHILFGFFQIYNKINDIDIVRSKASLNLSSDILQIILLATLHLKINLRKP